MKVMVRLQFCKVSKPHAHEIQIQRRRAFAPRKTLRYVNQQNTLVK